MVEREIPSDPRFAFRDHNPKGPEDAEIVARGTPAQPEGRGNLLLGEPRRALDELQHLLLRNGYKEVLWIGDTIRCVQPSATAHPHGPEVARSLEVWNNRFDRIHVGADLGRAHKWPNRGYRGADVTGQGVCR